MVDIELPPLSEHWHEARARWIIAATECVWDIPNGAELILRITRNLEWGLFEDDPRSWTPLPPAALARDPELGWGVRWRVIERLESAGWLERTQDWRIRPAWPVD